MTPQVLDTYHPDTPRQRRWLQQLRVSLLNHPPLTPGARLKRAQRRLAAVLGIDEDALR